MWAGMKFTQIPERDDVIVAKLEQHGHTYVDSAGRAEFIVLLGGPDDVPDPMPESVRFIQTQMSGIDALHRAGVLKKSGVRWANAAGLYENTVAESALALLLAVYHQHKAAGQDASWSGRARIEAETTFLGHDKTVAVIGAGGIGERVLQLLGAFGARTIAVTRTGRQVPGADESFAIAEAGHVWEEADAFILLMPLTEATHQMVNREKFARMKDTAVVVNVGRGALLDTDALVEALRTGAIGGAGLDVTDPEPLPDGHPLWGMRNVVITPHTANTGWNIRALIGDLTLRNAEAFAAGETMPTEVDIESGY